MTHADYIHVSNCEYAMCFLDATHVITIDHLTTHNNMRCICALPMPNPDPDDRDSGVHILGCYLNYDEWRYSWGNASYLPHINVMIGAHDFETGHFSKPFVS